MTTEFTPPEQEPPQGLVAERAVLPLENGDHLVREEFHERYLRMPEVKKAELIEGIVYMPGRVSSVYHAQPHATLGGWLGTYSSRSRSLMGGIQGSIFLDGYNEFQPDVLLRIETKAGGQSHLDEEGFVVGTPEFIIEVATSSASIELHTKKRVYQRSGVKEYLVWRVREKEVDWFHARKGRFTLLPVDEKHILRSELFPGLWLNVSALLEDDSRSVLETLQEGLQTKEHAEFIQQLEARANET